MEDSLLQPFHVEPRPLPCGVAKVRDAGREDLPEKNVVQLLVRIVRLRENGGDPGEIKLLQFGIEE
ncbi:hypothetical protein OJF2_77220 [Aquisphaera giovannonii]|uniref:Uncharacterized protein n=1 Tax=Aquisphaera giovannonii TaxID=406548 RepID=A0A5B9WGZ3_9BACT|nr:hypothetical protein OJF2_77220 [Aquisphaera giovannonii]